MKDVVIFVYCTAATAWPFIRQIIRANQSTSRPQLVPYRNSDLTKLFKNYFEGDGKVWSTHAA